ncbi:hypothetical protein [Legionella spiritensis]|uniref:Uncharacterized protein n=1 Tax=Legionella spiritensis TaxID=452 RepID=A0A0W0Z9A1_LEGSP|nr:hypothetical protein [Legionella spiritensis]KTD65665.1 hypothetical protein Lspi_0377 [Legionella spiritensis]SNV43653.1 Uncharacterised protein [Legionella spiritensis]
MCTSNRCIFLIFFFFIVVTSYAKINPSNLIKVDKETDVKCAEYYNYNGELYCSTTLLQPQKKPIDLRKVEKQIIVFDERPWRAAWSRKTDSDTTIEYLPEGDKIEQWHELVTSQSMPGLQDTLTPGEFSQKITDYLNHSGLDPVINIISESPDQVLLEFHILHPKQLKQHELQLITKGSDGIYVLHYVIKEAPMEKSNREKWIKLLKKSKVPDS